MKRLRGVAAVLGCCTSLLAQQVPDIDDVYAVGRSPAGEQLGPAVDPGDVLRRFEEALQRVEAIRYDVQVLDDSGDGGAAGTGDAAAGGSRSVADVRGAVVLGRGPAGKLDRFRVTLEGRLPEGGAVAATVGSTGRSFYIVDSPAGTVTESATWDDSNPVGRLARDMLIVRPTGEWLHAGGESSSLSLGPATVGSEACSRVHFFDAQGEEHVYGSFATGEALPRLLERVRLDAAGRPGVVATRIIGIEPAEDLPADFFEPPASPAQKISR
jgi:hypothetical protein